MATEKHSIGKTIATLRKEKGWTQIELAEKLQVSDKAVSKWESDAGMPSIEFFPAMAQIFGVTIDYLMTGKIQEKEIVIMSKIELCAKKDDPELIGRFNSSSTDENGQSLIYYIKKYNSLKVMDALCNKEDFGDSWCRRGKSRWIEQDMLEHYIFLMQIGQELRWIKKKYPSYFSIYQINDLEKCGYLPIVDYVITNYDKLNIEQKNFYFGDLEKPTVLTLQNNCVYAYPYYLDLAYKNGNIKLCKALLANILVSKIKVLRSTVEYAYKNGDEKLGQELNAICIHPLTPYDIDVIRIDNNTSLTDKDKQIAKSIHNGIMCIDELLELNDINLIEKYLSGYPIHPIENLCHWYQNNEWRKLFEHSIDYAIPCIPEYLINNNIDKVEKEIIGIFTNCKSYWSIVNVQYFNKSLAKQNYYHNTQIISSVEDILKYYDEIRNKVILELRNQMDRDSIISELTREYFEKELANGNIEIVAIKLCVRMEAVLRCRGYEGTFEEMLTKFCSQFNTYDDEDNNYDPHTTRMLHKLRMYRNSIVHSEKNTDPMTVNEMASCIAYICQLG